jgi:predicted RNase H-like HicB family nuclease
MRFAMVLEQGNDGGWGGYCPDLDGLIVVGDTRDDVLNAAPDAISEYLSELRGQGIPLPTLHDDVVAVEVKALVGAD